MTCMTAHQVLQRSSGCMMIFESLGPRARKVVSNHVIKYINNETH